MTGFLLLAAAESHVSWPDVALVAVFILPTVVFLWAVNR